MPEGGRESDEYRGFLGQAPLDAVIAEAVRDQHGVIGLDRLMGLGLTARAVHHRAAAGRLHRRYRGIYSLVPATLLSPKGQWLAAVLACGDGAALSHRSAAGLHELRATSRARIEVTVPGRSGRRHAGIDIHRSITLAGSDVTTVENIPCTTVARTLFDLADVIRRRPLERAFDQAEAAGILNLLAVEDQLVRNPTRAAAAKVRALLEEHYVGSTMTRSDLEEWFVVLCQAEDLPAPEVNQLLTLPDGGPPIRVDFLFREARVALETDGWRTHHTHQQFEIDRDNDQRLTLYGWRPVRTTWRQLEFRPEVLIRRLVGIILGG